MVQVPVKVKVQALVQVLVRALVQAAVRWQYWERVLVVVECHRHRCKQTAAAKRQQGRRGDGS